MPTNDIIMLVLYYYIITNKLDRESSRRQRTCSDHRVNNMLIGYAYAKREFFIFCFKVSLPLPLQRRKKNYSFSLF